MTRELHVTVITAAERAASTVKVGQVWKDRDKREVNRHVRVERIEGQYAYCVAVSPHHPIRISSREYRIRLDRLPTAFALVPEATA